MGGIWPIIQMDEESGFQQRLLPKYDSEVLGETGLWLFHWMGGAEWQAPGTGAPVFRRSNYYCLSHLIDGDGVFADGKRGISRKLEIGDLVLSTPESLHALSASETIYKEDFISFYGPVADTLFRSGLITEGVFSLGSARPLLPIIQKLAKGTFYHQIAAGWDLLHFLNDLHFGKYARRGKTAEEAVGVLLDVLADRFTEVWTVESMAEFCALSKNQFRSKFKEQTGVLPKYYLDALRMNDAAELLLGGQVTLADLAARYHYSDPFHFSRSFKRIMGLSPQNFVNRLM